MNWAQSGPRTLNGAEPTTLVALAQLAAKLAGAWTSWAPSGASLLADREGCRVLANDSYEAWLLAWPPGSRVQPHDHGGSHGAFVVCAGELDEVRWSGPVRRTRRLGTGDVAMVAPGVVHDVIGAGPVAAYSVHAYSLPLTMMRFYDTGASRVVAIEPVIEERPMLSAEDVAVILHPAGISSGR